MYTECLSQGGRLVLIGLILLASLLIVQYVLFESHGLASAYRLSDKNPINADDELLELLA